MSKWEQYKIEENNQPIANKWAKYRIVPIFEKEVLESEGDSWPALIGKSALKGATSIADLPRLAEETFAYPRNQLAEFFNVPNLKYKPVIPTTSDARAKIKEYTGVNLEPNPSTSAQRIASIGTEWAAPGGIFGAFSKVNKLGNIAKQAAIGTGIGGASGSLQEMGVNPLLADIGAVVTPYSIGATSKGLSKIGTKLMPSSEEAAKQILKDKIGKKNLSKVIGNLNTGLPFNAPANTAELAQNTGISALHRAMSPNIPAIAEKQAIADTILRNKVSGLSPNAGQSPYRSGEVIRGGLNKNLQQALQTRTQTTEPLYDALYKLDERVKLPQTRDFLGKEGEFAKGDIKRSLNNIESLISSNKAHKSVSKDVQKLYNEGRHPKSVMQQVENSVGVNPVPGELKGALTEITDKYKSAKKAGNDNLARIYKEAKDKILTDMSYIPEEKIARETYANLSKPVSAIEKEPLLSKFIKKDEFGKEFLLSPEKIPQMILEGSINNTKALMKQAQNNPKMLRSIRGSFIDEMFNKATLSSSNANIEQNLSYDKFSKFLKQHKGKLELVFDKNQIQVLNDARDLLKRRNMVSTLG